MTEKTEVVLMKGAQVVSVDKERGIITVMHHGEPFAVDILVSEMPEAWPKEGAVGILKRRRRNGGTSFNFRQYRSRYMTVEAFFAAFPDARDEIHWVDEVEEPPMEVEVVSVGE